VHLTLQMCEAYPRARGRLAAASAAGPGGAGAAA